VTTGHPAGWGDRSATQPAGEELKVTPEVIGSRFWFSNVTAGVPSSVQVWPERFVTVIPPSRDPAAPCIDPTARSCADVHAGIVEAEGVG
jgi:hypothetical protein